MCICNILYLQAEATSYGIDYEGPTVESPLSNAEVIVPDTGCPLNVAQLAALNRLVDSSERRENFGIDNYLQTKQIVEELVST